jgi:hypothetical protein
LLNVEIYGHAVELTTSVVGKDDPIQVVMDSGLYILKTEY